MPQRRHRTIGKTEPPATNRKTRIPKTARRYFADRPAPSPEKVPDTRLPLADCRRPAAPADPAAGIARSATDRRHGTTGTGQRPESAADKFFPKTFRVPPEYTTFAAFSLSREQSHARSSTLPKRDNEGEANVSVKTAGRGGAIRAYPKTAETGKRRQQNQRL